MDGPRRRGSWAGRVGVESVEVDPVLAEHLAIGGGRHAGVAEVAGVVPARGVEQLVDGPLEGGDALGQIGDGPVAWIWLSRRRVLWWRSRIPHHNAVLMF